MHFALIDKDRKTLEYLTGHTRKALKETSPDVEVKQKRELDIILVRKLGETAGRLFTHGVIHGQLHVHYQNVSVVGEFSDFDSSIFLNNYSSMMKNIPMPKLEKTIQMAHGNLTQSISKIEKKYKINIQKFIDSDVNKYTGMKKTGQINNKILAMYMLGQIYDIYNHAIKAYDLLLRSDRKNFAEKGTILTKQEITTARTEFMRLFMTEIKKDKAVPLLSWAIEYGAKPFIETYLNKKGVTTIYGWQKKTVPLNHLLKKCDPLKNKFIQKDGLIFLKQLKTTLFSQ